MPWRIRIAVDMRGVIYWRGMKIFKTAMLAVALGCMSSVWGQVERLSGLGLEWATRAPAENSPEWQKMVEGSTVLVRAQCRVFYRHVHVEQTEHGRVAHYRTVWFVRVLETYKGDVGIGDFVCFEEESESPTSLPVHTDDNHTPQPFCECILAARQAELVSPHNYMLRGVALMDLPTAH